MYVPFDNLPEESRIWIYQSNRKFSDEEIAEIENDLKSFDKFVHRTFNSVDFQQFIKSLQHIYLNHGLPIYDGRFLRRVDDNHRICCYEIWRYAWRCGDPQSTAHRYPRILVVHT